MPRLSTEYSVLLLAVAACSAKRVPGRNSYPACVTADSAVTVCQVVPSCRLAVCRSHEHAVFEGGFGVHSARSSRKLSELVGDEDRALLWATMSAEYAKVAKDESVGYDESSEVVEEDKSSDGCCKAVRVGSANCGHCGSPCARC